MDAVQSKKIMSLIEKGRFVDENTGRQYFTGYSYKTLYDWDQYFETIVQIHLGLGTEYAKNGVLVFLDSQRKDGFIVRLNQVTDVGCDSVEHAKPFIAQIVELILKQDKNIDWFDEKYYYKTKLYLKYWMENLDKNKNGLPEWNSAPHTGMDNQHERAGYWNECFCEGVDLASYLYSEFLAMNKICMFLNKTNDALYYKQQAQQIKNLVQKKMWCDKDEFFYDLNCNNDAMIRCKTIAGFMPLWVGISSDKQAVAMIEKYLINENEFWRKFPVSTMAASEKGFSETKFENDLGCNWRGNTWIPTNYIAMQILKKYHYMDKAYEIAEKSKWVVENIGNFEYYTSDNIQGCGLNPFWGWSLLAYFMTKELDEDIKLTL